MNAVYYQRGETIDFLNETEGAIPAGAIVPLVTRIGVAADNIPAGAVGAVAISGVFGIPKKTSDEYAVGDALYFDKDTEGGVVTKTAGESTVPAGIAVAKAGGTDAMAAVLITTPPAAPASGGDAPAGAKKLTDLEDVDAESPASGNVLKWDGTKWKPQADTDTNTKTLAELTDVEISSPAENQVLTYTSGGKWKNQTASEAV